MGRQRGFEGVGQIWGTRGDPDSHQSNLIIHILKQKIILSKQQLELRNSGSTYL